jgi:hypothetical protein
LVRRNKEFFAIKFDYRDYILWRIKDIFRRCILISAEQKRKAPLGELICIEYRPEALQRESKLRRYPFHSPQNVQAHHADAWQSR